MRFLFLSLLCFCVSGTYCCTEMPTGVPQVDLNALREAGLSEADVKVQINELLAEGLRQLLSGGNANFEGFKLKTYELLSNPGYLSLMEKASLMEGSECGSCGGIESDTCGGSISVEDTSASESCAALN